MAGSAASKLKPGTGRGTEIVGDLVLTKRRRRRRAIGKEKERRRVGGAPDGGRHRSECAVVSEEEVERQSAATGERATNKLPGRSQWQVKQRRRG